MILMMMTRMIMMMIMMTTTTMMKRMWKRTKCPQTKEAKPKRELEGGIGGALKSPLDLNTKTACLVQ